MSRAIKLATLLMIILSVASCGAPGRASNFSATTLEGDDFRLAEKRGEVVALYFMAGY
jgi:hypothetical protein